MDRGPHLRSRVDETPRFFLGGFGGSPIDGLGLVAGLLALTGLRLLAWRAKGDERRGGLLALGIAALAVAAAALCAVFLVSHFGIVDDSSRHRTHWKAAIEELGRPPQPRPIAVAPTYADTPLTHYGIPVEDRPDD